MQDLFKDSFLLLLPIVYQFVLSTLIGCSRTVDKGHIVQVAAFSFFVLSVPFIGSLWLQNNGVFDWLNSLSNNPGTSALTTAAFATVFAVVVSCGLLGVIFWWFQRRSWIFDGRRLIATWLCATALIVLFDFGRFISLYGSEVDSIWIDLALGVAGTWLVVKILMPWAMSEFWLVFVDLDRIKFTGVVSALILALMLLVSIVHGVAIMSPSTASPPISLDVFGQQISPWLVPLTFLFGCAGFILTSRVATFPRWVLLLYVALWTMAIVTLALEVLRFDRSVQLWIAWFSVTCGVFVSEGYLLNSTSIPVIPIRDFTCAWAMFMLLSSAIAASLALSTARLGVLIGMVTCIVFIATLISVAKVVLHLDMTTPGPVSPLLVSIQTWTFGGIMKRIGVTCNSHSLPLTNRLQSDKRIDCTRQAEASCSTFQGVDSGLNHAGITAGVIQDSGFGGILVIFFGFIPLILFSLVGLSTSFLSFIVFYSGFVAIGMEFIVLADVYWLGTCGKRGYVHKETPSHLRQPSIVALRRHIRFHTYWTVWCLWPITVLQWLELPLERTLREGDISTNIWNTIERFDSDNLYEELSDWFSTDAPIGPDSPSQQAASGTDPR